jgi:hypothetical protein
MKGKTAVYKSSPTSAITKQNELHLSGIVWKEISFSSGKSYAKFLWKRLAEAF